MRTSLLLLFLCLIEAANAQVLPTSIIDEALKEEANVVIRNEATEFEVLTPGRAIEKYEVVLSILNESGAHAATQYVFYSDLEKVITLSGEVYDKQGKRVKKIKNSEIGDVSASGSNMYTDNRLKVLDFSYPTYPYSIKFSYTVQHDGLMFYPRWIPQDRRSKSIEKASFKVIIPVEIGLNYFEQLIKGEVIKAGDNEEYSWTLENLPAFESEPFSPPFRDIVPMVMITPKYFEMEGYSGSMSSWEEIGKYELKMLEGKDELPPGLVAEMAKLTGGVALDREKVKLIYNYVQNSTRYVSVQLGIGGWEPFDPTYVYENGYGDCKALTNYTRALLANEGIESIYTSVYAGKGEADIVAKFPNVRFNHVILAVPLEQDTVWLECTSQTNPFGYLGSFTSDRHVLMATKEGGKLVKTPTYTEKQNIQFRKINVELTKEGDAVAKVDTEYSGLQYENVEHQLYNSPEDQKKWLLKNANMKKTSITDFSYSDDPAPIPSINEHIEIKSTKYASITGKRMFFEVNPLNKQRYIPKKVSDRKSEVQINSSFTDIDSIFFVLPEGFHVEHLPESAEITNEFGEYSATYHLTEEGLLYVRRSKMWKGKYPPQSYDKFRMMLKDISRYDRTKIVLAGST